VLAKLCEHYDNAIYDGLGFWSAHTHKHLMGAIGLEYNTQQKKQSGAVHPENKEALDCRLICQSPVNYLPA